MSELSSSSLTPTNFMSSLKTSIYLDLGHSACTTTIIDLLQGLKTDVQKSEHPSVHLHPLSQGRVVGAAA